MKLALAVPVLEAGECPWFREAHQLLGSMQLFFPSWGSGVLSIGSGSCDELESCLTGSDWTLPTRALLVPCAVGCGEWPLKAGLSRPGQ